MSYAKESDSQGAAPRELIQQAMVNVAEMRRMFVRAAQHNREMDPEMRREFHSAVINYYFALRPYRTEDALGDKWESAKLWRDGSGRWVRGVDTLADWINRKEEAARPANGRGASSKPVPVSKQLPPERLIRVSTILDDLAKDLGVSIDVKRGKRPAVMLDAREPDYDPEDVDE